MKRYYSIFHIVLFCFSLIILNSCDSKKSTINELRDLRTEIRLHGDEYDHDDWSKAEDELSSIHEKLEEYELTASEEKLISDLDAEIALYKIRNDPKGLIGEIAVNVAGFIDNLTGSSSTESVEKLAQSTYGLESRIEKKAKRSFWLYVGWTIGGIVLTGLCSLIVMLVRDNTTKSRRRTRVRNSSHRTRR